MSLGALVKTASRSALRLVIKAGQRLTAASARETAKKMARSIVTKIRNAVMAPTTVIKQGMKLGTKAVKQEGPSVDTDSKMKEMEALYKSGG